MLLENCSKKTLHTRPNVPGLSFKSNKLDVAYPATGYVQFTIETKATGVPKHPGNTEQKHPEGRAGCADLDKRLKEAAFKNIDLKAETARLKLVPAAGQRATFRPSSGRRRLSATCSCRFASGTSATCGRQSTSPTSGRTGSTGVASSRTDGTRRGRPTTRSPCRPESSSTGSRRVCTALRLLP